jgi:hypothetical protein
VRVDRLGHLALNTHLFFLKNKIKPKENVRHYLICPAFDSILVANKTLLLMHIGYAHTISNIRVVESTFLYRLLDFALHESGDNRIFSRLEYESKESEFSLGIKTSVFSDKNIVEAQRSLSLMCLSNTKKIHEKNGNKPLHFNFL